MTNKKLLGHVKIYATNLAKQIMHAWERTDNKLTLQELIEHAASHVIYMKEDVQTLDFRMTADYDLSFDTLSFMIRITEIDSYESIATLYLEDIPVGNDMICNIYETAVSISFENEHGDFIVEHVDMED